MYARTAAPAAQRGLTLIELVIFIVIIGVGVAGILSVINVSVKSSADPMLRKQSIAMAEAILEEALHKDYANPAGGYSEASPDTCANRVLYDDVDDYACFDGSPATAAIKGSDTLGAASIAGLEGYVATVAVAALTIDTVAMKRLTVTVTDPRGETHALTGYRANY